VDISRNFLVSQTHPPYSEALNRTVFGGISRTKQNTQCTLRQVFLPLAVPAFRLVEKL